MSFVFPTNASQVQAFAGALYGVQVGTVTMAQVNADIQGNGGLAKTLNSYYSATFGGVATATVASTVAANLGLTGAALTSGSAYIAAQLNAVAADARGAVISNIVNLFGTLSADATFGAAATAWNTKVATAVSYTGATNVAIGTQVVASAVFTLTAGTDLAGVASSSNAGLASTFKFSSGNEVVDGMTATIQAADTLVDGSTTDNDVLNITSTGTMNAVTSVNIETVNVAMSAGTPTAVFTNFSGLKNINVSGAVAATVTDAEAAQISVSNYTRVLTVNETLIDGTTAGANPDVTNITVSGLSFGTTAATQSGVTLTAGTAGVLETLNITSSGATENAFALDAGTNVTLSTVNLLGDANVTVRVDHDDINGVTINGAANTARTTLLIDRQSDGASATNLANVNGIDVYAFRDSTAGTDSVVVAGIADGSTVDVRSTFNVSTNNIGVRGATSSTTNVLSVNLDHATADTRLQLGTLDVQDVETLNLASNGHATALIAAGNEVSLVGDMTAIAMTGDTAIALTVNIDAPTTGTRSTAINASAMTAAVSVTANDTNTTNLYTITGTALSDTLVGGAGANVINGGEGNDAITGGAANDTIDAGAGNDTITVTAGLDTVTGGAGNDTHDVNTIGVDGVAQVSTLTNINTTLAVATGDRIDVVINGVTYSQIFATDAAGTLTAFVTNNRAAILETHGVTVASIDTNTDLQFTGRANGTSFTISSTLFDLDSDSVAAGNQNAFLNQAVTATTAATAGTTQRTSITDFAAGDVLDLAGLVTETTVTYHEGTAAAAGNATVFVLTDAAGFADAEAAEDAIAASTMSNTTADGVIIFLNSTLGFAQVVIDGDNDADATNLGNSTAASVIINLTGITTAAQLAAAFSDTSIVL
jgi:hypothetical protein